MSFIVTYTSEYVQQLGWRFPLQETSVKHTAIRVILIWELAVGNSCWRATLLKKLSFSLRISPVNVTNLVTFTGEMLNRKLHFLCSVSSFHNKLNMNGRNSVFAEYFKDIIQLVSHQQNDHDILERSRSWIGVLLGQFWI